MSVASTVYYNSRGIMKNVVYNPSTLDDEELKNINPLQYYLNHIGDMKIMAELRRENKRLYDKVHRLHYINSFKSKEPLRRCPKCKTTITSDEWGEEYCPRCGTVTRRNYNYVASQKHALPYGLKIV